MKSNAIVIENLNKFYGKKQAISQLNLTIPQGMFGLLGRNGAGKTTLMKVLATLLNKQSGTVTICGIPVEHTKEIRKITGYLPQEFSMYPSMQVEEALDYLGVLSGMTAAKRKAAIPPLLEKVNLTPQRKKKIRSLSGGMKRRLGIAQALLHNPRVLIVDEPTAGLDPEERIRFRNLLCEVAEERIVILSTHIVGDIEATCEQIAILDEGRLLYNGTVSGLTQKAEGKVYSATVPLNLAAQVKKEYMVTGISPQGKKSVIRLISEAAPDIAAIPVDPNVEDAYMYCLSQNKGGEE